MILCFDSGEFHTVRKYRKWQVDKHKLFAGWILYIALLQLYNVFQAAVVFFFVSGHKAVFECLTLLVDYTGDKSGDLKSITDLDKMIAQSLRDVPDDDSDDLSDTDDPDLLVSYYVVLYKLHRCVMLLHCVSVAWQEG